MGKADKKVNLDTIDALNYLIESLPKRPIPPADRPVFVSWNDYFRNPLPLK